MPSDLTPRQESVPLSWHENVTRTTDFWLRASGIYFGYKAAQLQDVGLRAMGWSQDRLEADLWSHQHEKAAKQMYGLCVGLRGFYLKAGQFLGARGDFVPEAICRRLALLHDQVPAMPAAQVAAAIRRELGGVALEDVFEWIDLEAPLGSASIAQVHKARLRCGRACGRGAAPAPSPAAAIAGDPLAPTPSLAPSPPPPDMRAACGEAPAGGVVAVKVQYPDALPTMALDLTNLRVLADFLSRTELKFDLLSAVDELAAQIRLEFDFRREARIMDAVARQFKDLSHKVAVPRSVPSMVTDRLLVMTFLEGIPITRLGDHTQNLSAATKRLAASRILSRVSEAYGRMMLLDGLFQADGHPGNILVMPRGRIGLIDYGQSKRLPDPYRAGLAHLILALDAGKEGEVSAALGGVGILTERNDVPMRAKMATAMFDTRGKADPFDPDSPIKQCGVEHFPPDMFFVLRVTQLLRGLAQGMGVSGFSTARQWAPFARQALKGLRGVPLPGAGLEAYTQPLPGAGRGGRK